MTPLAALAFEQIRLGNLDAAEEAIAAIDDPAEASCMRGRVALRQHKWVVAHDHFQHALHLDPDNIDTMLCLGATQFELGLFETATITFHGIILRDLNVSKAWLKLGGCHALMQRHVEALACFERAVSLTPNDPECHQGMATMCSALGIDEGALHHYRQAQLLQPGYVHAEVGEAATLLRMGDWLPGWQKFEARWRLPTPVAPWWYRGQPLYEGDLEGLRGKRVLLRSEQGFGDSIHFARYIEPLSKIAGHLTLETQEELARLFAHLPCDIVIAPRMENQVRPLDGLDYDHQTSLMSLPLLFGTTPDTCPPPVKLRTGKQAWREKIGLCWAGGPRTEDPQANAVDQRRSIDPDMFDPIWTETAGRAMSLQREHLAMVGTSTADWFDTAAVVAGLDLVITVDTAVAHLAASFGIETWMLCRFDSCWRWGLKGINTPWYPTMKIYRQPRLGDWQPVIDRVVADLKAMG